LEGSTEGRSQIVIAKFEGKQGTEFVLLMQGASEWNAKQHIETLSDASDSFGRIRRFS